MDNILNVEIEKQELDICLLKVTFKGGELAYFVVGEGTLSKYPEYSDASFDYENRWMEMVYGIEM